MRLEALGLLIECGIRGETGIERVSCGIEMLIDQECRALSTLRTALSDEHNRGLEGKLELENLGTIAMLCGVPKQTAEHVVRAATGISLNDVEPSTEVAR